MSERLEWDELGGDSWMLTKSPGRVLRGAGLIEINGSSGWRLYPFSDESYITSGPETGDDGKRAALCAALTRELITRDDFDRLWPSGYTVTRFGSFIYVDRPGCARFTCSTEWRKDGYIADRVAREKSRMLEPTTETRNTTTGHPINCDAVAEYALGLGWDPAADSLADFLTKHVAAIVESEQYMLAEIKRLNNKLERARDSFDAADRSAGEWRTSARANRARLGVIESDLRDIHGPGHEERTLAEVVERIRNVLTSRTGAAADSERIADLERRVAEIEMAANRSTGGPF